MGQKPSSIMTTKTSKEQPSGMLPSLLNITTNIVNKSSGKTISKSDWLNMQVFMRNATVNDSLDLSYNVIRQMSIFIEILSVNIKNICFELSSKMDILPDTIVEILKTEDETIDEESLIRSNIIEFVVTFAYSQNLILEFLKKTLKDRALEIIKYMTINSGLKNITPTVYRVLTWVIVQYLIDQKLIDQTYGDSILVYFTMIFGHMTKIYSNQSVPSNKFGRISATKTNDRQNRARDNFRSMKLWRVHLENILAHKKKIETQLANANVDEDALTIDTSILKDNDCLILCCRRMKTEKN